MYLALYNISSLYNILKRTDKLQKQSVQRQELFKQHGYEILKIEGMRLKTLRLGENSITT